MEQLRHSKNNPLVYLIVICHNSKKWLQTCLETLSNTNYTNYKIVVVDNCSTDGSIEEAQQLFDSIKVIKHTSNLGWCEGNNIAIEEALKEGAEYVVLLNADLKTEDPLWLDQLVEFATNNKEYGILGSTQYEYDSIGWKQINSWTEYILWSGDREGLFMMDTDYGKSIENAYTINDLNNSSHLECYFVQGAAMMIRADVFHRIGLFDKIYFMFYDEVDFCRRARWLNIKTVLIPTSRIKHVGAGHTSSSKKSKSKRNYYYSRNKYIYIFTDIAYSTRRIVRIALRFLYHDIKDAFGKKQDINGIGQLIIVLGSLLRYTPNIFKKRKLDKRQLKKELYQST